MEIRQPWPHFGGTTIPLWWRNFYKSRNWAFWLVGWVWLNGQIERPGLFALSKTLVFWNLYSLTITNPTSSLNVACHCEWVQPNPFCTVTTTREKILAHWGNPAALVSNYTFFAVLLLLFILANILIWKLKMSKLALKIQKTPFRKTKFFSSLSGWGWGEVRKSPLENFPILKLKELESLKEWVAFGLIVTCDAVELFINFHCNNHLSACLLL